MFSLFDVLLKPLFAGAFMSCVPYSFVVTKEGDIFQRDNVEHHSDLCRSFGLNYDAVLKPEFHIWDKKLTDVSDRLSLISSDDKMAPFYEPRLHPTSNTVQEYWLKNKFHDRIQNHIGNKFKNWKTGLEFMERNWEITRRYVPDLCKVALTPGTSPELLAKKVEDIRANFDERTTLTISPTGLYGNGIEFVISYKDPDIDRAVEVKQVVSSSELIAHPGGYQVKEYMIEKAKAFVTKEVTTYSNLDFETFKNHWSKKQNRVECWVN